jgi:hypothetical protein
VYKNKKVQWFSVIEPDAKLIAALVVTPFAPHFNYEKVDRSEIPYQDETKQGNGVYVTFFYINSGTCSVEQVENLTCNFSSFICDIASKLQHLPGLSQVNVDEYVTLSKDKAFWCD